MLGGGRPYLAHRPEQCMLRDDDDSQMEGIAEFFRSWPATDVKGWEAVTSELEREVDEGGCWTGGEFSLSTWSVRVSEALTKNVVETSSADMFPFVGAVPDHDGQWMAAGFAGHGESGPTNPTLSPLHSSDCRPNHLSSNRHAPNPPLDSQHHSLHPRLYRFQP